MFCLFFFIMNCSLVFFYKTTAFLLNTCFWSSPSYCYARKLNNSYTSPKTRSTIRKSFAKLISFGKNTKVTRTKYLKRSNYSTKKRYLWKFFRNTNKKYWIKFSFSFFRFKLHCILRNSLGLTRCNSAIFFSSSPFFLLSNLEVRKKLKTLYIKFCKFTSSSFFNMAFYKKKKVFFILNFF